MNTHKLNMLNFHISSPLVPASIVAGVLLSGVRGARSVRAWHQPEGTTFPPVTERRRSISSGKIDE